LWRAFASRHAWWTAWLRREFHQHWEIYLILALFAVAIFAVLGYLLGRQNDMWTEESQNVRESNFELSQLAATDALTGLLNARAVHERLDADLEDSHRASLTCLLIDIDHFKRINDKHGHPVGDDVLVAVARTLRRAVRRIDTVGRLGGEEFIIVLPGTGPERAEAVAERVRRMVEEEKIVSEDNQVHVTVSVGAAVFPQEGLRGKISLLKAADDALYRAKKAGRNRIVLWQPNPRPGQGAAAA
jgi:diguanylate cyclase (GGDEF)-like protein